MHFKELVRSYGELKKRSKAMEEYFLIKDSENDQNF